MITLRELVADTIATHGHRWSAEHYSKRIPFAVYYWLAFGFPPRARTSPPINKVRLPYEATGFARIAYIASWNMGWGC